jgi:hypothetical protein
LQVRLEIVPQLFPRLNLPERLVGEKTVTVQCLGSGEQGHWVAAVVGGEGVGEVGV